MHIIENSITINRSLSDIYNYVTQPHRWHEWHPASKSTDSQGEGLKAGATFHEKVHILWMNIAMDYKVLESTGHTWETEFKSDRGTGTIRYELTQVSGTETKFKRRLKYNPIGFFYSIVITPILRPFMESQSKLALANLKKKLEA